MPANMGKRNGELKPADLRGILRYVTQWRGHVFVIAVDSAVIETENFANILLDLAVLHNLHIRVALVYGIGRQIARLAKEEKVSLNYRDGKEAPVDDAAMELVQKASAATGQEVLAGLTRNGLRCVLSNAVRAEEKGILGGKDYGAAGKAGKVDAALLRQLFEAETVPLVPPVAHSRTGRPLILNPDRLASALAVSLKASKLIFLTSRPGLRFKGEFISNVPVEQLRRWLGKSSREVDEAVRGKARCAAEAVLGGVPRAHILGGGANEALLSEIFSQEGVGTLVHGNEYQQIRPARRRDIPFLHQLIRNAAKSNALRPRTRQSIEKDIRRYYVYEIDGAVLGCFALLPCPPSKTIELAALCVPAFLQKEGVGKKLADFACLEAARLGGRKIAALTTQSAVFFRDICGFSEGAPADLPKARRRQLEQEGRRSRVFLKKLPPPH